MPHPIGSKNREKRSLPERCKATEGAVRGVGLPEGSGIREIRSLLDGKTIVRASRQVQPPQSGPLDKLGDRIGLYDRTGLAGTTGFAGVLDGEAGRGKRLRQKSLPELLKILDGEAGREFKNVDSKLLTGSRSLEVRSPVNRRAALRPRNLSSPIAKRGSEAGT